VRLYYGERILMGVRIPLAWKKILVTKARKEKTTLSDVLANCLERKYGLGKGKVYKPKRDANVKKNR
jgi:hypothetical protein